MSLKELLAWLRDAYRIPARLAALERDVQQTLPAVVRALYLKDVPLDPPFTLTSQRFGFTSQNGEDGIILAIFKQIGMTDRRFVDIGCGFNGGNSGFLARELGWQGIMVDARARAIETIATSYLGYAVTPLRKKVTPTSLNTLLREQGLAGELDFLSIDIDGVDFWLWDGLEVCRPRVVAIEYNYLFGAEHAVTVPNDPAFDIGTQPTRAYRGASLVALVRLGRRKGYRLVATERVNAFFVRDDVAAGLAACEPTAIYRGPGNRMKAVYGKLANFNLPIVLVKDDGTPGETVSPGVLT